jgi:hypothetical protein
VSHGYGLILELFMSVTPHNQRPSGLPDYGWAVGVSIPICQSINLLKKVTLIKLDVAWLPKICVITQKTSGKRPAIDWNA